MDTIEELLFQLDNKVSENKIKTNKIDKYIYIYALEPDELKELVSINWNDGIILEGLIKAFSSNSKYKKDKIALLAYVSDNTDIKNDEAKILSCASVIKCIDDFRGDIKCLTEIVEKIVNSKTDEGARTAKYIVKEFIDFLNEEDYSEETMRNLRIRLSEIVGFVTRAEEEYKIKAIKEVVDVYPKEKVGTTCGLVYGIAQTKNKAQSDAIVDIVNSKDMESKGLVLKASLYASKLEEDDLVRMNQFIYSANNMSELQANDEMDDIINRGKSVQRKLK